MVLGNLDIALYVLTFIESVKDKFRLLSTYKELYKSLEYIALPNIIISRALRSCDMIDLFPRILRNSMVTYNSFFHISETLYIESSVVVFVNCTFVTTNRANVFLACADSELSFINCTFLLESQLGKCMNSSILHLINCELVSLQTSIPLLTLRMSSLTCHDVKTSGGNTFVFVNGRPTVFSMKDCTFGSEGGVELHNCKFKHHEIQNCASRSAFIVFSNGTKHFIRGTPYGCRSKS